MLWILTQDKDSLINVKELTVNGKKIKGIIGSATLDEWSKSIGKYQSNERALEVVSEVFNKIEENQGHSVTFAMPKE
ncbi:hypothetical protein [Aquisalibacillus elongatus]|uniref:Uncharacterized protein n=1 Tax=Aquisalibacillus elongatus TaxID=485577 RepID=A0A3N5B7R3_9BACI|nr:hypothetical protein [Aquisalibacillus elongatus]RPF53474.1 hypothetical protein EDC24_1976 [Aquisalibacillus elongatus]